MQARMASVGRYRTDEGLRPHDRGGVCFGREPKRLPCSIPLLRGRALFSILAPSVGSSILTLSVLAVCSFHHKPTLRLAALGTGPAEINERQQQK